MKKHDALSKAMELGLDLVEVSPDTDPPVCRLLDYGKHQYKLSKKITSEEPYSSVKGNPGKAKDWRA